MIDTVFLLKNGLVHISVVVQIKFKKESERRLSLFFMHIYNSRVNIIERE